MRMQFDLWFLKEHSLDLLLDEAEDYIGDVGKEHPGDTIWTPPRKKSQVQLRGNEGWQVCPTGYSSFQQHTQAIREYANKSPDNFAQVLLFAPLTANTSFSWMVEAFPALIKFLQTKTKTSQEEVAAFIAGSPKHVQSTLAAIVDKGGVKPGGVDAWKSKMIAKVWNDRVSLKSKADELNAKGDMAGLLSLLGQYPGMKPVKAGFVVQMLYGKVGCLDTHNIDMYRALAQKMGYKKIASALTNKEVTKWSKGKSGEVNPKIVQAYLDLLKRMEDDMGVGTQELWDLWVDIVAQLYHKGSILRDEKPYSQEHGVALNPFDSKWKQVRGPMQGSDFIKTNRGGGTNRLFPAAGHPAGGGVSMVHQVAMIDPDELLRQWEENDIDTLHAINAVISDRSVTPLVKNVADIIAHEELSKIISIGREANQERQKRWIERERIKDKALTIIKNMIMANGYNEHIARTTVLGLVKAIRKIVDGNIDDLQTTQLTQQHFQDPDMLQGQLKDFLTQSLAKAKDKQTAINRKLGAQKGAVTRRQKQIA